ncbi:LysR family transcriptional regulator [Leucobacter aridicollis]|uniref:Molybdate transport repressor ModE-like protein n=1 Tax=Leucobacter aridicollis TaxID=283878 RepID=A0A852R232_9MICO|nr:LysR family transcriptional regulator [Leucobacter aridicollis]NYD25705.1 molybdate transport repressor ModE-like protein [Leucobacter aridicollis]
MLDLRRLVILRELKHRGTMSAAARELAYTHSAISQQLAQLERDVGVKLLERTGRNVRLTPAGDELVRNTEAILSAIEKAEADLATTHQRPQGVVRLAAFTTISRAIIPDALLRLAERYPELQVQVTRADPEFGITMLTSRQVDAVLTDAYPGVGQAAPAGVTVTTLGTDPVRAYLPPGVRSEGPAGMGSVPWVLEPPTSAATQWALRVCRERGFDPYVAHTTSDLLFHLRMVEHGLAAAFLPDMVIRESGLKLTPSAWLSVGQERTINLLVREGSEAHPAHVAVREAVMRELGDG